MRIDLAVPFAEKDQAKGYGARWDPARKIWYVVDPADLSVFARWVKPAAPVTGAAAGPSAAPQAAGTPAPARASRGYITPRTDASLPDGPDDASAPW